MTFLFLKLLSKTNRAHIVPKYYKNGMHKYTKKIEKLRKRGNVWQCVVLKFINTVHENLWGCESIIKKF